MEDIQSVVNEYMRIRPININQTMINYKKQNRVKFVDNSNDKSYILGINEGKLYLKELMMK